MREDRVRFSLLKILIYSFLIVFLLMIIYFTFVYYEVQQSKTKDYPKIESIVKEQTEINQVSNIERFHGEKPYYIVFGRAANNENKIAFVPFENNNGEILTIDLSEVISEQSIIDQWNNNCSGCKFIKIIPGIINDEFVWELTYVDQTNRYVFDYLSMYDGSQYEQIRFKKLFH